MSNLFDECCDLVPPEPEPLEKVYRFTVWGRGQQRGSKVAMPIYGRDGKPVMKKGRVITHVADDNKKSKSWMQEVKHAAIAELGTIDLLKVPIELTARFYFTRPQSHFGTGRNEGVLKASAPVYHAQSPDLAKLLRSLEDALTKVVWFDDKLVCRYGESTGRYWTDQQERTEVEIRELVQSP